MDEARGSAEGARACREETLDESNSGITAAGVAEYALLPRPLKSAGLALIDARERLQFI